MKTRGNYRRAIWMLATAVFAVSALFTAANAQSQWASPSPNPNNNIYYNGGNVGIGTTAPAHPLNIHGTGNVYGLSLTSSSIGTANNWLGILFGYTDNSNYQKGAILYESQDGYGRGKMYFAMNDSASSANVATPTDIRMTIDSAGNVGIGTTSPVQKLRVVGGPFGVFNSSSTGGMSVDNGLLSGATSIFSDYLGGSKPKLHLSTYTGRATGLTGITIDTSGNVGIGTDSPASGYKLDVAGDLNVSGNIKAKFQDVGEWVASSEQIPSGTVVVLDPTKSNQVISSKRSYDTCVAGVISARPGLELGESGAGRVLVATSGRVLVKVDASRGPIHIGDLLVTSDIPGLAMKSEPIMIGNRKMHMPGTLIGKALEPLVKGSGKILVLLSLQ